MISIENILEKYWGYSSFRKPQKEIINTVLEGNDTIALLPTGGGKSICFQVSALAKEGVCIVISPLIALMQDQVNSLKKLNIKATTIASGTSQDEIISLFDNIKYGHYKFLYISPERLQSDFIQQKIKELNVSLVAIDEAHCISEWGNDFRPSYRKIKILKELSPSAPFIALTATANKKVLEDIAINLELKKPIIFKKSFFRENLAYQVFKIEDKLERLIQIFTKTKVPAIVYVNTRKKTVEIANFLQANKFNASYYHGGLSSKEKDLAFKNWLSEKKPIIVTTNAFGMGIDKANVGLVIHYNMPQSLENYVQETGRAGRNNKKSFGVLLYNDNDIRLFKEQLQNATPSLNTIKEIHKKLYQHFQIANGELLESSFDFNFLEFCRKYNFSIQKTETVLKILNNYGIIALDNSFNKKAKIRVVANHKVILNYPQSQSEIKNFLNILLRTYGGLFENEVKIDPFFIGKKAGITSQKVHQLLEQLQNQQLIEYTPIATDTSIYFLIPREDDKTINRFGREIKQFLKQKEQKAIDLLSYVKNNTTCKSIQLLSYFNEKSTHNCGICSVCIQKKKKNTKNLAFLILQLLQEKDNLTSKEIGNRLNFSEEDLLHHLQSLLIEDKIYINNQNKYKIK